MGTYATPNALSFLWFRPQEAVQRLGSVATRWPGSRGIMPTEATEMVGVTPVEVRLALRQSRHLPSLFQHVLMCQLMETLSALSVACHWLAVTYRALSRAVQAFGARGREQAS